MLTDRLLIGSSPLTRGKHPGTRLSWAALWLIPAHAGKTREMRTPASASWAHPRSRGENSKLQAALNEGRGSSPLTRGKHLVHAKHLPAGGLIPAHAGKTPHLPHPARRRGAHPRSRGENTGVSSASVAVGAHPRSRGENTYQPIGVKPSEGSSPLTRGKLGGLGGLCVRPGLIPAHAGKTRPSTMPRARSGAHPRSRGENRCGQPPVSLSSGSSPLTRGKRSGSADHSKYAGLIPAHAGKTAPSMGAAQLCRAHPRSRGENPPRLSFQAAH